MRVQGLIFVAAVGALSPHSHAEVNGSWRMASANRAPGGSLTVCLNRDKSSAGLFSRGQWRATVQPESSAECQETLRADPAAKILYIEAPLMKSTGAFLAGQHYIHCRPGDRGICASEFFESYDANPRYRVLRPHLIAEAIKQSGTVAALDLHLAAQAARKDSDEKDRYRRAFDQAKSLEAIRAFESRYADSDPEGLIGQLAPLKARLRLEEYRRRFDSMRDVKDMESFVADYVENDPDAKVPLARKRLDEERARTALEAKREREQKEEERRASTIEQLERQIRLCARDMADAKQMIERERRISAASGYENKLALRRAGEIIVSCEDAMPEARRKLAELRLSGGVSRAQPLTSASDKFSGAYLPWGLDVEGFGRGKCEITSLARSFDEARVWARENAAWFQQQSVHESANKIVFAYYDGLVRANAVRVFYKDMAMCKAERG